MHDIIIDRAMALTGSVRLKPKKNDAASDVSMQPSEW